MNRAPSKELEEEEILALGEESRRRGGTPGEPGVRGVPSVACVGVEPRTASLPQEGQKRAAPGTSPPQAEQVMAVAAVYHRPRAISDDRRRITKHSDGRCCSAGVPTGVSELFPPREIAGEDTGATASCVTAICNPH